MQSVNGLPRYECVSRNVLPVESVNHLPSVNRRMFELAHSQRHLRGSVRDDGGGAANGGASLVVGVGGTRVVAVVDKLDVREWEEAHLAVQLALPLAVDVHRRDDDLVADLRRAEVGRLIERHAQK